MDKKFIYVEDVINEYQRLYRTIMEWKYKSIEAKTEEERNLCSSQIKIFSKEISEFKFMALSDLK